MKTNNDCVTIQKTTDYEMFVMNEFNRGIDPKKVKQIQNSMIERKNAGEEPYKKTKAIIVREIDGHKKQIQEGHHRYVAARSSGVPLYYMVDNTDFDIVKDAGEVTDWKLVDIVKAFANQGNEEYRDLLRFSQSTGIGLSVCAALLSCYFSEIGKYLIKSLREGEFKITHLSSAKDLVAVAKTCKDAGVDFALDRSFLLALKAAMSLVGFDPGQFVTRVSSEPKFMIRRSRTNEYLEEIESMYNRRSRDTLPIKHLVIAKKDANRKSGYKIYRRNQK
jgi:hypothetical protein